MKILLRSGLIVVTIGIGVISADAQKGSGDAAIFVDGNIGAPARFGVVQLKEALKNKVPVINESAIDQVRSESTIIVGTSIGSAIIRELIQNGSLKLKDEKESLVVARVDFKGRRCLVVGGADDRGLMYALLDIADQVRGAKSIAAAIELINETSESPEVPVRSMAVFLHNEDDEKQWYYSKDYWNGYLKMLAANRWNTFNIIFSHQTPYLAPMYPFHVEVKEFPEVKVEGLTEAQRRKNLDMLRYISSTAKDRGLDFTLSVWQQIAWSSGSNTEAQESMVTGYSVENMTQYTYLALKEILKECPGITGLQLRLNYESGVDYDQQTAFFRDAVFRAAKESGREILIEIRDIGLLNETVEAALETGLPTRVSHKYWAEDLVFPYHPAKFVWTYSYGDWLKYPRATDHIYQVWSLGSHRLLLWGDPGFVKRFAPTTTFQDAVGFEICAPLSQKGFGNAPGAWKIFRDEKREYYQWEFERYWSYYQLFGRLTYNSSVEPYYWKREISQRFGSLATEPVTRAYKSASQVVSLISAIAISNFNQYVWPEKDMGGLINYYMTLKPFDRARFSGFEEFVDNVLERKASAKSGPLEVAELLESISFSIDESLDEAASKVKKGNKEFWATDKDFRILSGMAQYFGQKIRMAVALGFYYRSGDFSQLQKAITHAEKGLAIWKNLSAIAEQIYSPNLVFGPGSVGHWKDNVAFVQNDLDQLRYQEEIFKIMQNADYAFDFGPTPFTRNTETYSTPYTNDFSVERRFKGVFPETRYDPATGYGWVEGKNLEAVQVDNPSRYTWSGAYKKEFGNIPVQALMGDYIFAQGEAVFRADLPEGHYQVTVIVSDRGKEQINHGPMEIMAVERFGDRPILDNQEIPVGKTVIKRFNINMTGERFINFRIKFKAPAGAHFMVNAITFTRVEPHIVHTPVLRVQPGSDLPIKVTVTVPPRPNDEHPLTSLGIITSNASTLEIPTAIDRVTLKYWRDGEEKFKEMEMRSTDSIVFSASIPGSNLDKGKIHYFIEAQDNCGQIVSGPASLSHKPYFTTDITDDNHAPVVSHVPVLKHEPGKPLNVSVTAKDDSGIEKLLLYYRPTRQTMEYSIVRMSKEGDHYSATIPANVITDEYDLMYYIEAYDNHGNAAIHPDPAIRTPYYIVNISR